MTEPSPRGPRRPALQAARALSLSYSTAAPVALAGAGREENTRCLSCQATEGKPGVREALFCFCRQEGSGLSGAAHLPKTPECLQLRVRHRAGLSTGPSHGPSAAQLGNKDNARKDTVTDTVFCKERESGLFFFRLNFFFFFLCGGCKQ